MSYSITGEIIAITPTIRVGMNATEMRTIVVREVEAEYPDSVAVEAFKEKCDFLDNFKVGEVVTVHFNVRAREHNGRWFTSANLWKVYTPEENNMQHHDDNHPYSGGRQF